MIIPRVVHESFKTNKIRQAVVNRSQGKVELTHAHSIKKCDYHESLHMTMKPVITPMETSLTALIVVS